jgi:hypothetical protein
MRSRANLRQLGLCAIIGLCSIPRVAQAQSTVSPPLTDFAFGQISSLSSDVNNRQNTCSFGGLTPVSYSVTATGSGSGATFSVTNGSSTVPYEVQWAQSANATSGSNLAANQPLLNQSNASLLSSLTCGLGLQNATVIVIVRAVSLQQATAGSFTGTLSILLSVQ